MRFAFRVTGLFAGLLVVSACSSKETPAPAPSPSNTQVGNFNVLLSAAVPELGFPASTSLVGRVFDREPVPTDIALELDRTEGECELLVPANPFCDPDCAVGSVCIADGECAQQAVPVSVGVVRVEGLTSEPFTMDPMPPGYAYQPSGEIRLAYPPCAEGGAVLIEADEFELNGRCIAPLVLGGPDPIAVKQGTALPLSWTPPAAAGQSRVQIHVDLAHHGGKKGEINCDVADDGSFDIPEPLVTRLMSLGLAGYPTAEVTRVFTAQASAAPGIKLAISSPVSRPLDTGVVSCSEEMPCPSPQMCSSDRTCK